MKPANSHKLHEFKKSMKHIENQAKFDLLFAQAEALANNAYERVLFKLIKENEQ